MSQILIDHPNLPLKRIQSGMEAINLLYDRSKAVAYAHQWAHGRNPAYYNFDRLGGDCTNFVSQCLYAGCGVMNHTRDVGWYYHSVNDRAAAWTGVEYLHRFLIGNQGTGPYGKEQPIQSSRPGDIIQLSFDGKVYSHSLFVVSAAPHILVSTHTDDWDNRPVNTYHYQQIRSIQIQGVRP